jgi:histidinol-phosphate aminotransferase
MAVKSPYNVNSLSQAIGTKLYENKVFLQNRTKSIVKCTEKLYNELISISNTTCDFKVYPTKTNFVFIKTSFGKELWEYLKSNSVVIRYMGDYIRITAGTDSEINTTISLIKQFISER